MVRRASHQTFCFSGVNWFLQLTLPSVAQDQRMAEAYALVREHMQHCAEVNKWAYDVAVKPVSFQPGDTVWYFCPRTRLGTSPK